MDSTKEKHLYPWAILLISLWGTSVFVFQKSGAIHFLLAFSILLILTKLVISKTHL